MYGDRVKNNVVIRLQEMDNQTGKGFYILRVMCWTTCGQQHDTGETNCSRNIWKYKIC